jgi:hypothetical protein
VTGDSARVVVRRDGDVLSERAVRSGEQVSVTIEFRMPARTLSKSKPQSSMAN